MCHYSSRNVPPRGNRNFHSAMFLPLNPRERLLFSFRRLADYALGARVTYAGKVPWLVVCANRR